MTDSPVGPNPSLLPPPEKSGLSSLKVLLIIVGILAIVGLTIGGTVLVQQWLMPNTQELPLETDPTAEPTAEPGITENEARQLLLDLPRRDANDPLSLGSVDAPVVLLAYADYKCPHCRNFANDTLPLLIQEFVDTGELRIEWRDMPILGDQSVAAAFAAQAAANQGKYWEYHDGLIAAGNADPSTVFDIEFLVNLAEQVGVSDLVRFEEDISSEETFNRVQADYSEGIGYLGFDSTPSFVLGGVLFAGAQPIEVFRDYMAQELALVNQ